MFSVFLSHVDFIQIWDWVSNRSVWEWYYSPWAPVSRVLSSTRFEISDSQWIFPIYIASSTWFFIHHSVCPKRFPEDSVSLYHSQHRKAAQAWVSSIETVKSGLQATLIIKRLGCGDPAIGRSGNFCVWDSRKRSVWWEINGNNNINIYQPSYFLGNIF